MGALVSFTIDIAPNEVHSPTITEISHPLTLAPMTLDALASGTVDKAENVYDDYKKIYPCDSEKQGSDSKIRWALVPLNDLFFVRGSSMHPMSGRQGHAFKTY